MQIKISLAASLAIRLCSALIVIVAVAAAGPAVHAQSEPAWNPKSDPKVDIVLPMPGTYKMVFVRVPVPGKGAGRDYYGGTERIFELGDKSNSNPFEAPRQARIGANFKTSGGDWYLAFGKYEVTIGQYAALIGGGDVAKGLAALAEVSSIELLKKGEAPRADDMRLQARALHGLSVFEYQDFIARYNVWCLSDKGCIAAMTAALGKVGYFRLPLEHEWEYVARGGQAGMKTVQALPFSAGDLATYANVSSKSRLPDEIAKRSPLPTLPIYDLYGNVAELMTAPFAMDSGSGTVGAMVVRGGGFQSRATELRSSYREEVPLHLYRSSDKSYSLRRDRDVGIRLMVGATVRTHEATADTAFKDISSEFTTGYVAMGGGQGGGARILGTARLKAKSFGALAAKRPLEFTDNVGGPDGLSGWGVFDVKQYGKIAVTMTSTAGDVMMDIKHPTWEAQRTLSAKAGQTSTIMLDDLLPGSLWFKMYATRAEDTASFRVRLDFSGADTAGNLPAEARDLGLLKDQFPPVREYVGEDDVADYYKFRVEREDSIVVEMIELTADANIELLDDKQVKLGESIRPGRENERIVLEKAKPGTYFVRVVSKDNQPAKYRLFIGLGQVDTAGDSVESARDLGALVSQAVEIQGAFKASQTASYYKMGLAQASTLKVLVSKNANDIEVALVNGARKEMIRLRQTSKTADWIETAIPAGVYYVAVHNVGRTATPYLMSVDVRRYVAYTHKDMPHVFEKVGATPAEFRTTIENEANERWIRFQVASEARYRFTLDMLRIDRGVDIDLHVITKDRSRGWVYVAKSENKSGENESIQTRLEPGTYFLRVWRDWREVQGTGEVLVRAMIDDGRAPPAAPSGTPSTPGTSGTATGPMQNPNFGTTRVVGEFGDWAVHVAEPSGGRRKRCMVTTLATTVTPPEGWRTVKPFIMVSVEPGDDRVFHTLEDVRNYAALRDFRFTAVVTGGSGTVTIPVSVIDGENDLKTLEPCTGDRSGRMCVATDGLRGLTRGRELTLTGRSREGRTTTVVYSLRGYTQAITEMNKQCGNDGKTGWLIKK